MFKWDFLYFGFPVCQVFCISLSLVHSMGTTEKKYSSSLPPIIYIDTSLPLNFPQAVQSLSTSLLWNTVEALSHLCGPSLKLLYYVHVSLLTREPKTEQRGKTISLDLLATLFLTQPRRLVAFFAGLWSANYRLCRAVFHLAAPCSMC